MSCVDAVINFISNGRFIGTVVSIPRMGFRNFHFLDGQNVGELLSLPTCCRKFRLFIQTPAEKWKMRWIDSFSWEGILPWRTELGVKLSNRDSNYVVEHPLLQISASSGMHLGGVFRSSLLISEVMKRQMWCSISNNIRLISIHPLPFDPRIRVLKTPAISNLTICTSQISTTLD
jgi:hypothetical protein